MRVQPLASGSKGNTMLVRAGESNVLVDLGISARRASELLEASRVPPQSIDSVLVTHGHLDHTRGVGTFARRTGVEVVCAEAVMKNSAVRRAKQFRTLAIHGSVEVGRKGEEPLRVEALPVPHDADPTVALRLSHNGKRMVLVTDMGRVEESVARTFGDAHVLLLEFNHDVAMLRDGPYPEPLKRRIAGHGGHLSNEEGAWMLERMVGPELHTLVLVHLSDTNNCPDLARDVARQTLERLGRSDVRVVVAEQATPLDTIDV